MNPLDPNPWNRRTQQPTPPPVTPLFEPERRRVPLWQGLRWFRWVLIAWTVFALAAAIGLIVSEPTEWTTYAWVAGITAIAVWFWWYCTTKPYVLR